MALFYRFLFYTWDYLPRDVYIIARGEAEGNNVNVEGKESQG